MSIGSPCPDPKTIRSRLTVDEDLPHLVIARTSSSGVLTSVREPRASRGMRRHLTRLLRSRPARDLRVSCQVNVSSSLQERCHLRAGDQGLLWHAAVLSTAVRLVAMDLTMAMPGPRT